MEWQFAILIVIGGSLFLMMLGLPVAFCLLTVDVIGVYIWWGGVVGLEQLTASIRDGVGSFILLPIPLFILMGEIMYHANIVPYLLNSLDKWIGRLPGRLSLLAVGGGTILGTLTGVTMGSVALMGSTMVPEMERRGYKKSMVLGPVGSIGVLAAMIPPSILGVLIAGLAQISIGRVLIGIIIPGLLISALFATYIILRCTLQPSVAPPYDVPRSTIAEKLNSFIRYVLPIGLIIFLVIGLIFLGIATPSEAAATGVIGCFIIALIYGQLNWEVIKRSSWGCLQISIMVLLVIAAARSFGQVLAFSGANAGLVKFATDLNL
ncbi:MAG: TRAP transporter large permease subunit, partial [Dehalococcoidia bacterium]